MDGQNWWPPDEGNSNKTPTRDDGLILNEIEIKPEPTIKLEHENTADIVTVSATEHGASGLLVNSTGDGGQTGDTYDFNIVCDLNEAKPEVKKEKIDKETEKGSHKDTGRDTIRSPMLNDAKDRQSKKRQWKPKRGSLGSENAIKCAAKAKNTRIESTRNNKKKTTASKRKGKPHKCSSCDYTTSQKGNLNKHIRKHTGEKPFPCTHCAKRFKHKQHLQRHMRSHVSEFLFSCSNCLEGFDQSEEKSEHETSCKVRRFECHLCKEYSTFQKSDFEYHMRVHHTGEKPFGCRHCSKKFPQQSELKFHQKSHINPRPLKPKCSVCYRNFSQRIEKDEHEAKCKRRGYECYLCKGFTSNLLYHLKYHMRTHTGLKPFQCELCRRKSFKTKSSLERHLKIVHK